LPSITTIGVFSWSAQHKLEVRENRLWRNHGSLVLFRIRSTLTIFILIGNVNERVLEFGFFPGLDLGNHDIGKLKIYQRDAIKLRLQCQWLIILGSGHSYWLSSLYRGSLSCGSR